MAHVFVHYRDRPEDMWTNAGREFTRVPAVGEYIAMEAMSETGTWYRVRFVVHVPLDEATDYDSEVYAEPVNHLEALKAAFP